MTPKRGEKFVDVSEKMVVARPLFIDFASQKTGSPKHLKTRPPKQSIATEGKD